MKKNKQKLTIGDTKIISNRYHQLKMRDFRNWRKSYANTIDKAIKGKKLTTIQADKLVEIHLKATYF